MASKDFQFSISSPLCASAAEVWNHASSFIGVNRELWPWVRMTCPRGMERITPEAFPVGATAFRSWILLFGIVPIEYDDIALIELEPGRGFCESSRMFTMSQWRHRRTIVAAEGGCVVTDEITMVPRWYLLGVVLPRVYRLMFEWRHHRLRRLFGHASPLGQVSASGD